MGKPRVPEDRRPLGDRAPSLLGSASASTLICQNNKLYVLLDVLDVDPWIRSKRSRLSSSVVSSMRVATVHTCPDGSMNHAVRSPQNWLVSGISTLAPALIARSTVLSTFSTYT